MAKEVPLKSLTTQAHPLSFFHNNNVAAHLPTVNGNSSNNRPGLEEHPSRIDRGAPASRRSLIHCQR